MQLSKETMALVLKAGWDVLQTGPWDDRYLAEGLDPETYRKTVNKRDRMLEEIASAYKSMQNQSVSE